MWSGNSNGKVRLNPRWQPDHQYGLHMMAVTQARGVGPGKAYLDKLMSSGKTRTESLRLLRRRLSDAVLTALRVDERARLVAESAAGEPVPAAV